VDVTDLLPPVRRLSIGTLRSIVLLDEQESRLLTPQYAYLSRAQEVRAVFGEQPFLVIGEINVGSPVMYDPAGRVAGVYVDSVYRERALTRIADSLQKLFDIVLLLQTVWMGKAHQLALEKTPENLALREDIIARIRLDNPESDNGFWNYLAFKEFDIRLRE
jgi:hypothetical protein